MCFEATEKKNHIWELTVAASQIDGLVQDYSISSALALEILQSCTKLSKYGIFR